MFLVKENRVKGFRKVNLLKVVCIGLVLVWTLFPIYWMANNSFKNRVEQFSATPTFWPQDVTLENYTQLLGEMGFLHILFNSFVVAFFSTIIAVSVACLSAYSLSRFRFKGKKLLLLWILLTRVFPPVAFVIPLYTMFGEVDLLNTRTALVLAYIVFNLPFAIWLLINFFNEIPVELEESAMMDGATPFQSFSRIVLPLVVPGIGATSIFTFIMAWNEFLYALIFIQTPSLVTAPVALSSMITEYLVLWGPMSAGGILSVIPMFVFVIFMQKTLIKGLTMGAVKG